MARLRPLSIEDVPLEWIRTLPGAAPTASLTRRMIAIKRVYEPPSAEDGTRFLVERLWPRGVRKDALPLDGWLKDVAPSAGLRRWFGHDPVRWEEFRRRYAAELDARPGAWAPILQADRSRTVTLLFSAHDAEHNNAVALKAYLEAPRGEPAADRKDSPR